MWDGVVGCEVPDEAPKDGIGREREETKGCNKLVFVRRVAQAGGGTDVVASRM
jgi:hypothetical protein